MYSYVLYIFGKPSLYRILLEKQNLTSRLNSGIVGLISNQYSILREIRQQTICLFPELKCTLSRPQLGQAPPGDPSLQEWTGDSHKLPYSGPDIRVQPIKAGMQNLNITVSEITISCKV